MKKLVTTLVIIVILAIIFFALGPFYIIEEGQQAVVTRFGAVVNSVRDAGLKFKMPVIDTVVKYPKRILSWDGDAQRIPTAENQFIWVDTTARWKVTDPLLFYESVTHLEQGYARLDEVIDSSVRTIIADNPLKEAVRNTNIINTIAREKNTQGPQDIDAQSDLGQLTFTDVQFEGITKGRVLLSDEMFQRAAAITPDYGIELIDIVVRQIRYSDDLTESVYNRMIKERNQIAEAYRSYGAGQKAEWLGKLDNERRKITSEAYRTSEEIKGDGDAQAARIYAEAYEADPEFFEFWRSIESYRKILPKFQKTLTTDMEYFKYLYDNE
jgi:modulator of FtsH protease HflC